MFFPVILGMVFQMSATVAQGAPANDRPLPSTCTYETAVWNVHSGSSSTFIRVSHAYAGVTSEERDPASGCTVCSEDQVRISIPALRPFSLCYKVAPKVRAVLEQAVRGNEPVHAVEGYRVVKSRGPLDGYGNRTQFSNHSFGTAIDINPEQNGLYDNCTRFGPACRLIRGGHWRPGTAGTLEPGSALVQEFSRAGFRWGGEMEGRQKDFMHFSLTGY